MRAVRDGRIYCVSDQFFNTPAHTLSGGLRIIRWAMYPDRYWRPEGVRALGEPIPAEVALAETVSANSKRKQVVAGLMLRGTEVLICQRGVQQSFAMQWEFPGGKVESRREPARCPSPRTA